MLSPFPRAGPALHFTGMQPQMRADSWLQPPLQAPCSRRVLVKHRERGTLGFLPCVVAVFPFAVKIAFLDITC